MERCDGGGLSYITHFHRRKAVDRILSGKGGHWVHLRRRRVAGVGSVVGLLLGAAFFLWSGVYESLCEQIWIALRRQAGSGISKTEWSDPYRLLTPEAVKQ